jgi:hypothetical protein
MTRKQTKEGAVHGQSNLTRKTAIVLVKMMWVALLVTACVPVRLDKIDTFYTPLPESSRQLDIPKYGNDHRLSGYPYVYWHFSKQKQQQLGLVSPETSTDSLVFRLWITNPSGRVGQPHALVELRKDSLAWHGTLVLMRVDFRTKNLTETITRSNTINLEPLVTNWKTVADSLMFFKIDSLPTDDLIPDYYANHPGYVSNSVTFSFEYATKEIYRFYQYNDIYRVPETFWQPNNVIGILDLLEREFQWDAQARSYFK